MFNLNFDSNALLTFLLSTIIVLCCLLGFVLLFSNECIAKSTGTPTVVVNGKIIPNTAKNVKASFYGNKFHGRLTASGERFDKNAMTVAHKSLPFGTKLRVTNRNNSKSIIVTVNDRGPYVKGRALDLSEKAFGKIAKHYHGVITVDYVVLSIGDGKYKHGRKS